MQHWMALPCCRLRVPRLYALGRPRICRGGLLRGPEVECARQHGAERDGPVCGGVQRDAHQRRVAQLRAIVWHRQHPARWQLYA